MAMDLAKDMELEKYDDFDTEPVKEAKDLSLFYGEVYVDGAWMKVTSACETSVEARKLAMAWLRKKRKEQKKQA